MLNIFLLTETEAAEVRNIIADKSLSFLSYWEPGVYRAIHTDGEESGFVLCSSQVAGGVNQAISKR